MKNFIKYWSPVVLMAALLFIGSSISELPHVPVKIPYLDKWVHLGEYTLLSLLLRRALGRDNPNRARSASLWAVIWSVLYGITDELHQSQVPNREMSAFDLLFDGLGAILGQVLYFLYLRIKTSIKE